MSHALVGDLEHFPASEVLQFLSLVGVTGRLVLERSGERAELFFEHGRPVFARTSGLAVRTGEVLVHRGAVDRATLLEALAEQRARPGPRLASLLLARRAITREQATQAVSEVMRRILYGLTAWRAGRFDYAPGQPQAADDLDPDLDLERVILEGLSQADLARPPG